MIQDLDIEDLVDLKDIISTQVAARIQSYQPHYTGPSGDENLDWVRREVDHLMVLQITEKPLKDLKQIIHRIDTHGKPRRGGVTPEQIERALQYPIHELYEGRLRGKMGKCPFHEDKTASLSFGRHNRFYCFACSAKGSVIDYYMRTNGVGFVQAVRSLTR